MVVPGYHASLWVVGTSDKSVQPGGVDLSLSEIHRFLSSGSLGETTRSLAKTEPIQPVNGFWHLKPGVYKAIYKEVVRVPYDCIGILLPRSSLLRIGATILSAVWDPGYIGRGEGLLIVFNPHGISLELGTRIGQIIFIRLESKPHTVYKGVYQHERISETKAH
mgnify:CR=1 FL=1